MFRDSHINTCPLQSDGVWIWSFSLTFFVLLSISCAGQVKTDTTGSAGILNLLQHDRFEDAFARLEEMKTSYKTRDVDRAYIHLLLDVAYTLDEKGSYEPGLSYCFYVLDLCASDPGLELEKTKALLEIGSAYYFLGLPELSLKYTNNALAIASANNYKEQVAAAINKVGLYYEKTGKYQLALRELEKSLRLRKELGDVHGQSATLGNIGIVLEKLHRYDEALERQLVGIALDDSIGNKNGVAWSQQMLGSLFIKMNRLDDASAYLDKSEEHAERMNSNELLMQVYWNKKILLETQGNFKQALEYANRYESLRDSIHSKELLGRAAILQSETELKEKRSEIEEQKLMLSWQRYLIMVGVLVTLVVSSMAYLYYRSFKTVKKLNQEIALRNREISAQSEELQKGNVALVKLNQEIAEQKEEIQAQSEELTESHETIVRINENLELIVRERTAELVQAYKELDTFFYRASHDFRRPLTTFMGLSEVAKITVKDPYALELFEKVQQTASNLDKMLLKLQSISDVGLQQLNYKEVSSEDLFNMVFAAYREELVDAHISFRTDAALTSFNSYPAIIKIILENLVENAIFFRRPENAYVKLAVYSENGHVVLTVSDNGQGIDEQYQDQIFNMYFRGNENSKGNGLGLYIVKKATEKLKGRITFTSIHNEGSTFSVFLPREKH